LFRGAEGSLTYAEFRQSRLFRHVGWRVRRYGKGSGRFQVVRSSQIFIVLI
jgi:hypothetical protein